MKTTLMMPALVLTALVLGASSPVSADWHSREGDGKKDLRNSQYERAATTFQKAISDCEEHPKNCFVRERGILYYELGLAYEMTGNKQAAIERYKKGYELFPTTVSINGTVYDFRIQLIALLREQGRDQEVAQYESKELRHEAEAKVQQVQHQADERSAREEVTAQTGEATSWTDSPLMKAVDQMDQRRQELNRDVAERDRQAKEQAREQLARANEAAREQLAAAEAARQKAQSAPSTASQPSPTPTGALLVTGNAPARTTPTPRPTHVAPTATIDVPLPDITLSNLSWTNPINSGDGCSLGEGANPQGVSGTWWRQTLSFSIGNSALKTILVNVSFRVGDSTTNRSYRVAPSSTTSFSEQFATSCSVWVPLSAAYRWQVTSASWAAY